MKTVNRPRRRLLTIGLAALSTTGLGRTLGAPALAAAGAGYLALGDS